MNSFSELNLSKQILKSLDDLGFKSPTPIQQKAFNLIMSGKDVVGIAQTGTGKTFAYLLPILRQMTFSEQRQPRVLIVVPTRELVVQVVEEIKKLTTYFTVRTVGIYGGGNINTQKQTVYNGVDILVATPGRLMDMFLSRAVLFHSIKKLVIDEVDEMLNLGFRTQLMQIVDALPSKRQNLLFSATLNEDVEAMITNYFNSPNYIELITRGTALEKIIQRAYLVPNFYTKVNLLKSLLFSDKDMSKILCFVKNKRIANELFEELEKYFLKEIGVIHSNFSQAQRFKAVKRIQDGTHRMLIATDVIARGIDIANITHVINFNISKDPGSYIHRIGRTGRADKIGIAISFISKEEEISQKQIEALMKKKIPLLKLPKNVEISDTLTDDEKPRFRDKSLAKIKKLKTPSGGFSEKQGKNKMIPNKGARRQENERRMILRRITSRSGRIGN